MSVLNIHENLLEALLETQAYSEVQVFINKQVILTQLYIFLVVIVRRSYRL